MKNPPSAPLFERRVKIVEADYRLTTNAPWLIQAEEYFGPLDVQSLLTNYYTVVDVPSDDPCPISAQVTLLDVPGMPFRATVEPDALWIAGDLTALEHEVRDRRYTIFGNMGLFFRYSLAVLQRQHGIVSMHASSFYHPGKHELLIVGGGTGAGKSVYLFESLKEGYEVFTAEMTFFRIQGDQITFYKGALHDNVWTGSIQGEYATIIREKLGVTQLEARQNFLAKAVVDLTPVSTREDVLQNPSVLMLLSRLEQDRQVCSVTPVGDSPTAAAKIYEIASEKLQPGFVLYERFPAPAVDDSALQAERLRLCQAFVDSPWMRGVRKVVAGPSTCMEAIR